MEFLVDKNPKWVNRVEYNKFKNNDMLHILSFFVFNTPCDELSAMSKTLKEYGWSEPWKKPFYLNKQLKQGTTAIIKMILNFKLKLKFFIAFLM